MRLRTTTTMLLTASLFYPGCGDEDPVLPPTGDELAEPSPEPDDPSPEPDDPSPEPDGTSCGAVEVSCQDQSVQQLLLKTDPNPAEIVEESDGSGVFISVIDARGGGLQVTESYVYAQFTDEGLRKVDIGDEAAFESRDWDIALRRFVIRLNSGVSGPSCVEVARLAPETEFDAVDAAPEDLEFRTEAYFAPETCEFVADGGFGGPSTAMISYWEYDACLQMTGNIFVVALADGRYVKLEVLSYYEPANQDVCNETGTVPQPSGAAQIRLRWAFL